MVELSAGASVALGVLVGLLSTTIQSVGLTLQRKSHLLEDEKEEHHTRRPPYRRRRWQLGMFMFIVSNIVGSTIQITTLPLPVLSTLQASGLVFNTICATLILGEPFTRFSLAGTILVTGGAVLIGTFGALTEPSHNLNQLLDLLARRQFMLWLIGTFLIVGVILASSWALKRLAPRSTPRIRLLRGMCFGCVSGILSAHSLLVAKSAVELIVRTIVDRINQFNRWQSWMILLGLVALALAQLYFLHRGLKLCSTSVLYPFVFCIYNIVAILDGLIYFRQASRLPVLHAVLIALGTVILLTGVVALSWRLDEDHLHHGHHRPPTSPVTTRSGRTPTISAPQTVLTPGLNFRPLREPDDYDDSDLASEAIESPPATPSPLGATEEGEGASRSSAKSRGPGPSESTPLLRPQPQPLRRSPKMPVHASMTLAVEEASHVWDELNDRGDDIWPSPAQRRASLAFLQERRQQRQQLQQSPASPGLAGGGGGKPSSPWSRDLDSTKGKKAARSATQQHGAEEEDGHEMYTESDDNEAPLMGGSGRRRSGGGGGPARDEEGGGWFKLRWWKRRWREG
ncbi:magnesium transporter NIPA-domain-containing protein [Lineolata rhizophorae]|uniref:Magnesium transporter NIPA-domain-containing protein n=1 Tax=Lineolata rhizophorae TaxID=578093 RepID=A0A6A6NRZ7_9PEZI|nr:magnesium transporter NIPA-domain-containing protein [Lineolata rhizophorae]